MVNNTRGYPALLGVVLLSGLCASVAGQAPHTGDSLKGLTTPVPNPISRSEGIADLGSTKLWYWDTGGSGPAIVLLHPGSGSSESYPYQQPAFANARYRVISYSRRGQYKSELGSDAQSFFAADDLLHLMKHLKVEKFHLVGNALGGSVALDVAISHPDRVLSLVVANSMMGISDAEFTRTLQTLRPPAFNDLPIELKELGPSYRAANPAGVAEWKKRHERAGAGSPVRLRNKIDWTTLSGLTVPTLLVTGDADLFMPPFLLRQVGDKIPHSTVVVIPNAGHAVGWEQPELFNNTVLEFIRSKTTRSLAP